MRQMKGPQNPLPRVAPFPPAFPHGNFQGNFHGLGGTTDGATGALNLRHSAGTSKVRAVGVGRVGTGAERTERKLPSLLSFLPRPGNSTAGILSIFAMGAATMITQFRPSKRSMRCARMARRFRSYEWEEAGKNGREVRLSIPIDQTIEEKDVEIDISESKLRVSLGNSLTNAPVIDSDLYHAVRPHESHWFIERTGSHACVAVTLTKKNIWTQWSFLTTQEAASFLAEFEPRPFSFPKVLLFHLFAPIRISSFDMLLGSWGFPNSYPMRF